MALRSIRLDRPSFENSICLNKIARKESVQLYRHWAEKKWKVSDKIIEKVIKNRVGGSETYQNGKVQVDKDQGKVLSWKSREHTTVYTIRGTVRV